MSVWICLTTFCTCAAAGGGGGGGGGGATKNVSNCALGSCSVNASGMSSMTMITKTLIRKDVVVAKNLRFLCPPNSSTLSENIMRGGRGGPQTISERGRTAAVERLAGFTSASGSWSSIVPTGNLPASIPPFLNLSRRGMCHERSHLRFLRDIFAPGKSPANGPHHGSS